MATKVCHQCRTAVDASAMFCSRCGARFEADAPKKKIGVVKIGLALLGSCFVFSVVTSIARSIGSSGGVYASATAPVSAATTTTAVSASTKSKDATAEMKPLADPMAEWRGLPASEHIAFAEGMLKQSHEYWKSNPTQKGKPPIAPLYNKREWDEAVARLNLITKPQAQLTKAKKLVAQVASEADKSEKARATVATWGEGEKHLEAAKYACEQFVKRSLHDPDSAEFELFSEFWGEMESPSVYHVQVKLRARNAFNALRQSTVDCKVIRSGDNWMPVRLKQL